MAIELENTQLTKYVKELSLRTVLFDDFKSIGKELPMKGGAINID